MPFRTPAGPDIERRSLKKWSRWSLFPQPTNLNAIKIIESADPQSGNLQTGTQIRLSFLRAIKVTTPNQHENLKDATMEPKGEVNILAEEYREKLLKTLHRIRRVDIRACHDAFEIASAVGIEKQCLELSQDLNIVLKSEISSINDSTLWYEKLRQSIADASKVNYDIVPDLLECKEPFKEKRRFYRGGFNQREQVYLGSKSFFPRETVEQNLEALYGTEEVDLEGKKSFRMSYIEDYALYRGRGDGVGQRINIGHWKGVIRVSYPVVGESDEMQKLFCKTLNY